MSNLTVQELAATFLTRAEDLERRAKALRAERTLLLAESAYDTSVPAPTPRTKFVIWYTAANFRSVDYHNEFTKRSDAEFFLRAAASQRPHIRDYYEVREIPA